MFLMMAILIYISISHMQPPSPLCHNLAWVLFCFVFWLSASLTGMWWYLMALLALFLMNIFLCVLLFFYFTSLSRLWKISFQDYYPFFNWAVATILLCYLVPYVFLYNLLVRCSIWKYFLLFLRLSLHSIDSLAMNRLVCDPFCLFWLLSLCFWASSKIKTSLLRSIWWVFPPS